MAFYHDERLQERLLTLAGPLMLGFIIFPSIVVDASIYPIGFPLVVFILAFEVIMSVLTFFRRQFWFKAAAISLLLTWSMMFVLPTPLPTGIRLP